MGRKHTHTLLLYIIINLFYYVLKCFCFVFVWCPCMATNNVSVQHNGGFLAGIILLTQCYYHRGTRLNAMKRFCIHLQPMIPPKRFDISPPDWGMLRSSKCVQIFNSSCVNVPRRDKNDPKTRQNKIHRWLPLFIYSTISTSYNTTVVTVCRATNKYS